MKFPFLLGLFIFKVTAFVALQALALIESVAPFVGARPWLLLLSVPTRFASFGRNISGFFVIGAPFRGHVDIASSRPFGSTLSS